MKIDANHANEKLMKIFVIFLRKKIRFLQVNLGIFPFIQILFLFFVNGDCCRRLPPPLVVAAVRASECPSAKVWLEVNGFFYIKKSFYIT